MPRSSAWPAHHVLRAPKDFQFQSCGVQSRLQFSVRTVWASILFWSCWACCSLWAAAFANGSGPSSSAKRCPFVAACIARANLLFFCKANSLEAFSDKGVLSSLASHRLEEEGKERRVSATPFRFLDKKVASEPAFVFFGRPESILFFF